MGLSLVVVFVIIALIRCTKPAAAPGHPAGHRMSGKLGGRGYEAVKGRFS